MSALKFSGLQIGTKIKAWDHQPRPEVTSYIEGRIVQVIEGEDITEEMFQEGRYFDHYVVEVSFDTNPKEHQRDVVFVPMEMNFDFVDRIEVLNWPEENYSEEVHAQMY